MPATWITSTLIRQRYPLHDGIVGSITHTLNGAGNLVNEMRYDAFGNQTRVSGSQGHYGYTGEEYDAETGLLYLRARYYDPSLGRFISADPYLGRMAEPVTQNRYIYVHNNPLGFVDPTGLVEWEFLVDAEFWAGIGKGLNTKITWEQAGDYLFNSSVGVVTYQAGWGLEKLSPTPNGKNLGLYMMADGASSIAGSVSSLSNNIYGTSGNYDFMGQSYQEWAVALGGSAEHGDIARRAAGVGSAFYSATTTIKVSKVVAGGAAISSRNLRGWENASKSALAMDIGGVSVNVSQIYENHTNTCGWH